MQMGEGTHGDNSFKTKIYLLSFEPQHPARDLNYQFSYNFRMEFFRRY